MRDEHSVGDADIIDLGEVSVLTRGPLGVSEDNLTIQALGSMGLTDE